DQGFTIATYRAETRHRVRLGARSDGKLVAYTHEGWEVTSRKDMYLAGGTEDTTRMYRFGNVATKVHLTFADRNTPGFMRSPPDFPYMYALESALDELALILACSRVHMRGSTSAHSSPMATQPSSTRW